MSSDDNIQNLRDRRERQVSIQVVIFGLILIAAGAAVWALGTRVFESYAEATIAGSLVETRKFRPARKYSHTRYWLVVLTEADATREVSIDAPFWDDVQRIPIGATVEARVKDFGPATRKRPEAIALRVGDQTIISAEQTARLARRSFLMNASCGGIISVFGVMCVASGARQLYRSWKTGHH